MLQNVKRISKFGGILILNGNDLLKFADCSFYSPLLIRDGRSVTTNYKHDDKTRHLKLRGCQPTTTLRSIAYESTILDYAVEQDFSLHSPNRKQMSDPKCLPKSFTCRDSESSSTASASLGETACRATRSLKPNFL